ncbi:MAG: hypothetical protein KAV82_01645 [Phycisphaerae bacterium]|nr:hypothetical protein [Phycisphaerae bacterium]
MIQCSECEHFHRSPDGEVSFTCNPFHNIKEPQCLTKWQLIKLDTMVQAYQATLRMYERLAPLQEKMFRHMEREIQEQEDAENWKYSAYDDDDDDDSDSEEDEDHPEGF